MASIVYQSKLNRFKDLAKELEKGTPLRSKLQSILNDNPEGMMDLGSVIDDLTDALLKCRVFALSLDPTNKKGCCFVSFIPKLMFLFRIHRQWKSIESKLKDIKAKANTSSSGETVPRHKVYGSLDSSWPAGPSNIIGLDAAQEKLRKTLEDGSKNSDGRFIAIAILGMGGSGKTTLAQKLLNSFDDEEFEVRIWVSTSNHLYSQDYRSILLTILHQLQNDPHPTDEVDEVEKILKILRKELENKSYLIVLDGVHHVEDWLASLSYNPGEGEEIGNKLSHGLPKRSGGGAVIVTTREEEAAEKMVGKNVYVMERLEDDECWRIFQNSLGDDKYPDTLSRMKKDICYDCQGVPLVAKTLGTVIRRSELATHRWD